MNGEPFPEINTLIERLGLFQENRKLLKQALAHRSYIHEAGGESNERLEFLGDSVLSLVISEFLFKHYPQKPEGDLSKWRAYLVSTDNLARLAKKLGLGRSLLLGVGEEKSGGRERRSILADAMEALIAAIYLEYGWDRVKSFILEQWQPLFALMEKYALPVDPKTHLQELLQAKGSVPRYQLVRVEGPDHNRLYTMAVYNGNCLLGQGVGRSKKEAQQEAAEEALKDLEEKEGNFR
ncbi:MAG: ribonuclease III [Firmicutes bacterium]|nr:ribonuclease III [Bacillota bacterium]